MSKLTKIILSITVGVICLYEVLVYCFNVDYKMLLYNPVNTCMQNLSGSCIMNVHFLDVGKADSILISCDKNNILIDAADKDVDNKVANYLLKNNVEQLDLVVVTHPHRDHIGQMSDVVNKFDVKRFIMPCIKGDIVPTTSTYEKLLKTLDHKKISPEYPVAGACFEVGKMKVEIFAPNDDYDNLNNYSVVLKVTYGDKKFLFTGDAEKESENDMISKGYDLKCDVLKVGHHGSRTASTQQFLSAVSPKIAVVSVGEDKNNLPKKEVINRLTKNKIEVLRTDYNGNIILSTDGKGIEVIKEKE